MSSTGFQGFIIASSVPLQFTMMVNGFLVSPSHLVYIICRFHLKTYVCVQAFSNGKQAIEYEGLLQVEGLKID